MGFFHFRDGAWIAPPHLSANLAPEAGRLHGVLVERADEIGGCPDGSAEDAELKGITDALEAYEEKRWPEGRVSGRQGVGLAPSLIATGPSSAAR
jgi:hypothetical protein